MSQDNWDPTKIDSFQNLRFFLILRKKSVSHIKNVDSVEYFFCFVCEECHCICFTISWNVIIFQLPTDADYSTWPVKQFRQGQVKAKLIHYIPLKRSAIFFLAKTGYWLGVCHGWFHLHGITRATRSDNRELPNENSWPRWDSNSQPLNHKSSAVTIRPSHLIYYRQFKT